MKIDLSQLRLPRVSTEGLLALDLIEQPEPDFPRLTKTILRDAILALTLIKYANSPLYRRSKPIDTVQAAIRLLGLKNIRSAIIVATLTAFARDIPKNCHIITRHSHDISFIAARLARHIQADISDEMAFLGLIHDMGMLVLASNFPDIYTVIMAKSIDNALTIGELEETHFGIHHDDIIEQTFKAFRLPTEQISLLSSYHRAICLPEDDPQFIRRTIMDLAHGIWLEVYHGPSFFEHVGHASLPEIQAPLNITENDMDNIKAEYLRLAQ